MGHGQSCCVSKKSIKSHTTAGGTYSNNKSTRHPSVTDDSVTASSVNRHKDDNPPSFLAARTHPHSSHDVSLPPAMPRTIQEKSLQSSSACVNSTNSSSGEPHYRVNHPLPPNSSTSSVIYRTTYELPTKQSNAGKSECPNPRITSLFNVYRDADEPGVILAAGIEKLCQDLHVDPEDHRILILAWKMNASVMCRFTYEEFVRGCVALSADSVRSMSSRLLDAVQEVRSSPERFEELYKWSFSFAVDKDAGQRNLPVDMAVAMWRVVFAVRDSSPPSILEPWLNFLEERPAVSLRSIPRDTWDMFLRFVISVGYDLTNYSEEEAWPCLLDDFVEHENDMRNQNLVSDRPRKEDMIVAELNKELTHQ